VEASEQGPQHDCYFARFTAATMPGYALHRSAIGFVVFLSRATIHAEPEVTVRADFSSVWLDRLEPLARS
jgi:hypothetical protein